MGQPIPAPLGVRAPNLSSIPAPLEHVTLSVATGYEEYQVTEATPGSFTVVGQPINEVPKWTGSATAQYSVPRAEGSPFIRAQYTYTGLRTSLSTFYPRLVDN